MKTAVIACLLLGGCAYTTSSTQVSQIGADTYSVGATAGQYVGGSAEARSIAIQKANAYCSGYDRATRVVAIEPASVRVNVTFMCLSPDDPRMRAPMPGQTFNVNVNAGQ